MLGSLLVGAVLGLQPATLYAVGVMLFGAHGHLTPAGVERRLSRLPGLYAVGAALGVGLVAFRFAL